MTAFETSPCLAAGLTRTPVRGWIVVLSPVAGERRDSHLVYLGIFLPFIAPGAAPLCPGGGTFQSARWVTSALLSLPCVGVWFSRCRPVPLVLTRSCLGSLSLVFQGLAQTFLRYFPGRLFRVLSRHGDSGASAVLRAIGRPTAVCPGQRPRSVPPQLAPGHGHQHQRPAHYHSRGAGAWPTVSRGLLS